jgi:hypothetical protein
VQLDSVIKKRIMSRKIIVAGLILTASSILSLMSCSKDVTLIIPNNEEVTQTVSFKDNLVPMFTKNCALSGCHNTGGLKPDLSADKAFSAISNGNYADLTTPENSLIYLWLTGKKGTSMPVGAANNPDNINQFVLAWIKQGAKNN